MKNRRLPVLICLSLFFSAFSNAQLWTITDPVVIPSTGLKDIVPLRFITYQIDEQAVKEILWQSPDELLVPVSNSNTLLTVGMANGTSDIFRIVEYEMMEAELASAYPEIRTYRGISISNPYRTMRADWTENGFRAAIRDLDGTMYVDPYQRNDRSHLIAYFKKDISRNIDWSCGTVQINVNGNEKIHQRVVGDCIFRSYRIAVAATGEYSNFFGATSAAQSGIVLSEVTTAVNRLNDVYEVDMAVRLILIANSTSVFYYVPASDPYSGSACTQLSQNQTTIDNIIGSANYDIGHVFNVGSGGCAGLGVLCSGGNKAKGATGLNPPTGDPFYIDYVAHEVGHQFGGNHTQNNNCNRNAATAMEPGSASTIMGYAGICSPNVQNNSDAYFHGISLQEAAAEISSVSCHVTISSANSPPVVGNVPNYTIPISTPFVLTASATDPNNDPLTYCWEQWDQEVGTMPPVSTNTVGPMFRSLLPSSSPSRYFYNLPDLTNNINPSWEELPSVGRAMEFRVTVRDLHDGSFGCTDEDNVVVTTNASAGPFIVTSQSSGGTWQEGTLQTITWNVANTTASPISCANVDIRLSYDGGFTYPGVLSLNEPNDGTATVTIPIGITSAGRVMVRASGNIFFDINDQNITIQSGLPNYSLALIPNSVSECNDGSVQTTVIVGSFMGFTNPVSLSLLNPPPGAITTFVPAIVIPGNSSTLTISNLSGLFGTFTPVVRGTSTTGPQDVNFQINLSIPAAAPVLTAPLNHAIDVDLRPNLSWSNVSNASSYDYQVSLNSSFNPLVQSGTSNTNQVLLPSLLSSFTTYYWRIRPTNLCGEGAWSSVFDLKTMACQSFASTNVPITIPSNGSPTVTSNLTIPISGEIIDMNISNLVGTHTYVDDLKFTLISPATTQVLVWDRPCGDHDNFNINFDDEAANMSWPCPPTNSMSYKPNNPMTPFDGQEALGTWVLKIQDIANQDGGSLTAWSLRVCTLSTCQLTVTQTTGTGSGTLPGAFDCAFEGDTILLSSSLSGQTIDVGSSPLILNKSVTIIALAPDINITGSGTRPFEIGQQFTVEFNGMAITAGNSTTAGAILNQGTLKLKNVIIERNINVSGAILISNTGGTLKLEGSCSINQ